VADLVVELSRTDSRQTIRQLQYLHRRIKSNIQDPDVLSVARKAEFLGAGK
jgi:hypothetical protein